MAFPVDINFVDMFFDREDPFLNIENSDYKNKKLSRQESTEWLNDDFLNSLLGSNTSNDFNLLGSTDCILPTVSSANSITASSNDSVITNTLSYEVKGEEIDLDSLFHRSVASSVTSDGESDTDGTGSSTNQFDISFTDENTSTLYGNTVQISDLIVEEDTSSKQVEGIDCVKEEVIECEEVSLLNDNVIVPNADLFGNGDSEDDDEVIYVSSEILSDDSMSQNVGDSSFSSNLRRNSDFRRKQCGRSFKKMKTLKGFEKRQRKKILKLRKSITEDGGVVKEAYYSTDDTASDDSDTLHRQIKLTPEEKKLMIKEGIVLPTHYPLTKQEEKELKRIRRKIRNKISAQDSRRRKKEYVDGLEERVKRVSEENVHLCKYIKQLQTQNSMLSGQVKKLQLKLQALSKSNTQTVQPSTCLFVLFLSLALVLAPNLHNSPLKADTEDEGISLSDGENSVAGGSRSLLFTETASNEVASVLNEESNKSSVTSDMISKLDMDTTNVNSHLLNLVSGLNKLLRFNDNSSLKEHDYFRPRKRSNSSSGSSDSDDSWSAPPCRKSARVYESQEFSKPVIDTITLDPVQMENFQKSKSFAELQQPGSHLGLKQPVVIDLMDE